MPTENSKYLHKILHSMKYVHMVKYKLGFLYTKRIPVQVTFFSRNIILLLRILQRRKNKTNIYSDCTYNLLCSWGFTTGGSRETT